MVAQALSMDEKEEVTSSEWFFRLPLKNLNTPHGRFLRRSAAERFFVSETCFL